MVELLLAIIVVLLLLQIFYPNWCSMVSQIPYAQQIKSSVNEYVQKGPFTEPNLRDMESVGEDYNSYLKQVALDPNIESEHKEWVNDIQINLQPRQYSVKTDCTDGPNGRIGLLRTDYNVPINEEQNISVPTQSICTEGTGGKSRWGGYF